MHTCSQCGAVSPAEATWCTQCYLPFPAAAPTAALAPVGAASRFGTPIPSAPPSSFPPPVPPQTQAWAPPTWAPTAGMWPPPPMPDDAPGPAGGRLLDRRAGALVAIAICLGAVIQLIALALSHRHSIEPDTLIRYDLVLTLSLYAAVAIMIVSQITPSVRLRWGDGPLAQRVGVGVLIGAGLSGLLLAMVSGSAGHLRPDPRVVLLMSEGDLTHILLTILIACVAAPVIEETLFRGLLLESLRPIDTGVALVVSAMAFAVWHLTPAALVYYTAMGAVLGGLYIKRGLAASMAAHVGFNGVLTIAAIFVVLGPAHTVNLDGMSFKAPSGWSVQSSATATNFGAAAVLRGPDDAIVEVIEGPVGEQIDPDAAAARLQSEELPFQNELSLDHSSVREETLPIGRAIEANVSVEGRSGEVVLISAANRPYAVVFLDAGSAKASSDFTKILNSAQAN